VKSRLLANTNDAASEPGAGVSGGETELVTSFAEIVDVGVNDDRSPDDGKRTGERDSGVGDLYIGDAIGTGVDVTEITSVSNIVDWSSMRLSVGIEMSAGGGAAVGVVAEFVDMKAVGARGETLEFAHDGDRGAGVGLGEVDRTLDDLASQDANSLQRHFLYSYVWSKITVFIFVWFLVYFVKQSLAL